MSLTVRFTPVTKSLLDTNLIWRNQEPIETYPEMPTNANIIGDPLLDSHGGLMPDSMAIDKAVGSEATIDARKQALPKDGDNDGVAISDIGAIEQ